MKFYRLALSLSSVFYWFLISVIWHLKPHIKRTESWDFSVFYVFNMNVWYYRRDGSRAWAGSTCVCSRSTVRTLRWENVTNVTPCTIPDPDPRHVSRFTCVCSRSTVRTHRWENVTYCTIPDPDPRRFSGSTCVCSRFTVRTHRWENVTPYTIPDPDPRHFSGSKQRRVLFS
jgi:hypothetical protein